ncbi:MAG: nucleotidyl transferase AbiEii/AbiGii toxin family protein [Candidatus Delongbacteria bacterium]|nr:nucleotidyl transferase AbiEii/AbiGii toxin family protein [Candidatus Delongbacteria bacterium]
MLQYRTIDKRTLELLKQLMQIPELYDFALVGGTALALQLGHRISIDLDLFTNKEFNKDELLELLEKKYTITDISIEVNALNLSVEYPLKSENTIKLDLIKYSYPKLKPIIEIEGIRLFDIEDIIPMKLSAIANRGSKKDFYDIYYILKRFSLTEMMDLFHHKFPNINQFHIIKSLTYFIDAECEPDPIILEKSIIWSEVKKKINYEVSKNYS